MRRLRLTSMWKALFSAIVMVAASVIVALPAQPAMAGTCSTPGCGGKVKNNSSLSVEVVNCWHDTSSGWAGNTLPPCATMYSLNSWNAGWWVNPGGLSTNLGSKYYDVDAFYARPGCVTTGWFLGGTTLHYDRRGATGLWVRVYGTDTATINYVIC